MSTKPRRGAFTSRDEEIERLKGRLNDYEARARIKPLIEAFHKSLGAYMGATRITNWPKIMQDALMFVGNKMPTAYQEFVARNKKFTRDE